MKKDEGTRFKGVAKPILDASGRAFTGLVLIHETRVRRRARVAYAQWEADIAYSSTTPAQTPAPEMRRPK